MPTTLRIALLAGLLALLSNLAVIGFIYVRTHDEAVANLHRQVVEQSRVLTDVYRTGGRWRSDEAIDDTLCPSATRRPPSLCSTPTGASSRAISPRRLRFARMQEGDRSAFVRLRGQPSPQAAKSVLTGCQAANGL